MIVLLGAVALVAMAVWAVRCYLRSPAPVGYALVPAKDFDPSMEEVRRFGAGLVEARTAVGRGTKTRQMVRLAIVSNPEGDLVTLVSSSPRARSVLERVGYSGCALEAVDEVMGDRRPTWLVPPVVVPSEHTPPGIASTVDAQSLEPVAGRGDDATLDGPSPAPGTRPVRRRIT